MILFNFNPDKYTLILIWISSLTHVKTSDVQGKPHDLLSVLLQCDTECDTRFYNNRFRFGLWENIAAVSNIQIYMSPEKAPLEGLNAPIFKLGEIKNVVGTVLFRIKGIVLNW